MQEASGDLEPTLHPAGEGLHDASASVPQADHVHHLLEAAVELALRHPVQLGVEAKILGGREVVVEGGVLEHETDLTTDLVSLANDVEAGDPRHARARAHEGAQHGDRRRLAGTVRTQESVRLARRHREVHAAYGLEVPEAHGEVDGLDRRCDAALTSLHVASGHLHDRPRVPAWACQPSTLSRSMTRALSDLERGTIVVLPSATFPESELRKIVAIQHYEERLLCTTLLLANPELQIVYITSLPVDEAIVEYYLRFVPDPAGARSRLHLVVVGEDSGRALTSKVLDAPHVIDRVRALTDGAEHAYVLPFNVTPLEGRFSELTGLPLFGARPELATLGSKTESRRAARKAGVAVLDGGEDLRSVAELEAAIRGLHARRPDAQAAVMKLNDGFSGQGHAIVELEGFSSLESAAITFIAEEETWPSYSAKVESGGAVVEELVRVPGIVSPSVQVRISPGGAVELFSNHDQILGGLHDQVYLGCRFPA